MKHFAALDVSLKQTSVCIVDDAGGIVREAKVATEPDDLRTFLRGTGLTFERIGLEAAALALDLAADGIAVIPLFVTVQGRCDGHLVKRGRRQRLG
jgi:hypothetical protein